MKCGVVSRAAIGIVVSGIVLSLASCTSAQERAKEQYEVESAQRREQIEVERQKREIEDVKRQQRYDDAYRRY